MSEPTTTSMFIDTDSFDFEHEIVDDVDALTQNSPSNALRATESDYSDEDDTDYYDEYEDPTDGVEDLTGNLDDDDRQYNPHNGIAPEDYFDTLDDDATIMFGDKPLTKQQLNEIVKDSEFIKNNSEFYKAQDAFAFNQYNDYIQAVLNESTSETDRSMQWLQQAMQQAKRENNLEYLGKLTVEFDKYKERKTALESRNAEIKQIRDLQQAQIINAKIQETDTAMMRKYGQRWVTEGAGVYQWAVDKGIPFESLKGALCPALADILMSTRDREMAYLAKKNQNIHVVQEKIKAVRSKSSQRTTNRARPVAENSAKRGAYTQKMRSGGLSPDELSSMFDSLVD